MNVTRKTTLVVLLSAVFIQSLQAQFKTSKFELGINAGTLVYQGDLSKSFIGDYKYLRPAVGLYVSKALDPYFSVRVNATFGKIGSDESKYSTPYWKQYRAFKFSSSVTELSSTLVFNPFGENSDARLSPYIFAGAGLTFLNVKRDWSKYNQTYYAKSQVQIGLGTDTLHNPPKVIAILPVGAGLRYVLSSQLSLKAEATYRFTATDYLDGFKYSGNPRNNDSYYGLSVGISYRIGGYKCPAVRR